jgi:hypothetical protein
MRDNVIERSLIPHHLGHDMQLYGSPVPQSFFGSIKPQLSALYFLTVTEFCVTNDLGYSFHSQVLSSFMTYHRRLVTRVTRWVPLVEHELLTLPEHLFFSVGFMLLDLLFFKVQINKLWKGI